MFGASRGAGDGLRWALVCLSLVGIGTAILFWKAASTLREDMES
jgi:hypothetical protein